MPITSLLFFKETPNKFFTTIIERFLYTANKSMGVSKRYENRDIANILVVKYSYLKLYLPLRRNFIIFAKYN